jgi:hypothetical protein
MDCFEMRYWMNMGVGVKEFGGRGWRRREAFSDSSVFPK